MKLKIKYENILPIDTKNRHLGEKKRQGKNIFQNDKFKTALLMLITLQKDLQVTFTKKNVGLKRKP